MARRITVSSTSPVSRKGESGAIGGMFMAKFTGWVLDATGSYLPMFVVAGSTYLLALLIIHLLVPRMEPARMD